MVEKIKKFILFYQQQGVGERRRIRDEFMAKSGISYPGWYAKLHRKSFTSLELDALSNICNADFNEIETL